MSLVAALRYEGRFLLALATFLCFALSLQRLRPLQDFVLDRWLQIREIPGIANVLSVFGKSLGKVAVLVAHCGSLLPLSHSVTFFWVQRSLVECDFLAIAANRSCEQCRHSFTRFGAGTSFLGGGEDPRPMLLVNPS
jgi:hypothetical protein